MAVSKIDVRGRRSLARARIGGDPDQLGRRPRHIKQNGRSAARARRIVAGQADRARGNRQTSPAACSRTALTAIERREEACEAISQDAESGVRLPYTAVLRRRAVCSARTSARVALKSSMASRIYAPG